MPITKALTRTAVILPMTQFPVNARSAQPRFYRVTPHDGTLKTYNLFAACGVMDITSDTSFHILLSNFGTKAVRLPAGMKESSSNHNYLRR